MAFIPVPGVIEVKLDHTYFGTGGKGMVMHYIINGGGAWTIPDINDCLDALVTWWDTHLQPLMSPQVTLNRIRARDLSTVNSLQGETTAGLPLTGTRSGTPLTANVVLALKKVTGFTGKSFRGRVYHFGLCSGDVINTNYCTTATINSLEAAYNESLVLVGGLNNYDQVLVSRYADKQPRTTGILTLIQDFQAVDQRFDTNRKKLPKGTA